MTKQIMTMYRYVVARTSDIDVEVLERWSLWHRWTVRHGRDQMLLEVFLPTNGSSEPELQELRDLEEAVEDAGGRRVTHPNDIEIWEYERLDV